MQPQCISIICTLYLIIQPTSQPVVKQQKSLCFNCWFTVWRSVTMNELSENKFTKQSQSGWGIVVVRWGHNASDVKTPAGLALKNVDFFVISNILVCSKITNQFPWIRFETCPTKLSLKAVTIYFSLEFEPDFVYSVLSSICQVCLHLDQLRAAVEESVATFHPAFHSEPRHLAG